MKVEILRDGTLLITPDGDLEEFALSSWLKLWKRSKAYKLQIKSLEEGGVFEELKGGFDLPTVHTQGERVQILIPENLMPTKDEKVTIPELNFEKPEKNNNGKLKVTFYGKDPNSTAAAILKCLQGQKSGLHIQTIYKGVKEIKSDPDLKYGRIFNALVKLQKTGQVVKEGSGRTAKYCLPKPKDNEASSGDDYFPSATTTGGGNNKPAAEQNEGAGQDNGSGAADLGETREEKEKDQLSASDDSGGDAKSQEDGDDLTAIEEQLGGALTDAEKSQIEKDFKQEKPQPMPRGSIHPINKRKKPTLLQRVSAKLKNNKSVATKPADYAGNRTGHKSIASSLYATDSDRIQFAELEGYKNVAHALEVLGSWKFENQLKSWIKSGRKTDLRKMKKTQKSEPA